MVRTRDGDENAQPEGEPKKSLRRKAEVLLEEKDRADTRSQLDRDQLVHELRVHQIELELQNEELRNALSRAESAEEKYFRLYDRAPVGYAGFAPDGTILDINLAGAELLGRERKNCIGRRIGIFLAQKELPAFNRFLGKVFSGPAKESCEVTLAGDPGPGKILRIEGIQDENGEGGTGRENPVCRAALVDVTDLRRTERILRLTNKKLKLLTGITRHDIKNQLLTLSGNLELSKRAADDPEKTKAFIGKEEAIADIIGRQILFTKDYENLGAQNPVWQDIRTLVLLAEGALRPGHVQVESSDAPYEIHADPLLQKVFYNLMDNSLRYGGSALSVIRVTAKPSAGVLVVVFEDNGAGIPDAEKPLIFDRGYGKNTGYGLFLTREILDLTGCTIAENGVAGQGARFEIRVPAGDFRPTGAGPEGIRAG